MKRNTILLSVTVLVCCLGMAAVDGLWKPDYWLKSALKVLLFLTVPLIFAGIRKLPLRDLLCPDKQAIFLGLTLGGGAFFVIIVIFCNIENIFCVRAESQKILVRFRHCNRSGFAFFDIGDNFIVSA